MINEEELFPMLGDLFIKVGRKYSFTINPKKEYIEFLFSHDKKNIKGKGQVDLNITNKELCETLYKAIKEEEKRVEDSYWY